jgi:hypothetical protein
MLCGFSEMRADLFGAIARFIDSLGTDIERIGWALCDAGRIAGDDPDGLEVLARSPLFERIIGFVTDADTPWVLFVQASVFVAQMMRCGLPGLMAVAFQDGLFFRALRALLEVDHASSKSVGLDALGVMVRAAQEATSDGWIAGLLADEWIGDQLAEIAEGDECLEVAEMASAVLRSIPAAVGSGAAW